MFLCRFMQRFPFETEMTIKGFFNFYSSTMVNLNSNSFHAPCITTNSINNKEKAYSNYKRYLYFTSFFFIVIKITPSNSFVSEEHEFKSEDAARDKNFTSKPEITSKITQVRQDVCNNQSILRPFPSPECMTSLILTVSHTSSLFI